MNRYLTLSVMLHGVVLGGVAIWGGAILERASPEIMRVRILDERGAPPAGASPDSSSARLPAAVPEQRAAIAPSPARRAMRRAPARRTLPSAAARESEAPAAPAEHAPPPAGETPAIAALSPPAGFGDRDGAAAERDDRIAEIRARIQAALLYPREARRRGVEGTVQLRFALAEDGRLRRLAVRESSGERLLDRASIDTIRRAQPFPFVEGDLDVPVVFRLTSGR